MYRHAHALPRGPLTDRCGILQFSELCLESLIKVFRGDLTGDSSLDAVRLLNRMIKERKFNVHPEVLSCLLHLRLKTELGVRSSDTRADRADAPAAPAKVHSKGRAAARRAKGKATEAPHLSKKAKQQLKEKKEIEKELREAEAEVDKDERAATVSVAIYSSGVEPSVNKTHRHSKRRRSNFSLSCTSGFSSIRSLRRFFRRRCAALLDMRTSSTLISSRISCKSSNNSSHERRTKPVKPMTRFHRVARTATCAIV